MQFELFEVLPRRSQNGYLKKEREEIRKSARLGYIHGEFMGDLVEEDKFECI